MSSLCDGIGTTGLDWGMRGEDIEHNPRKQHKRINENRIISRSSTIPSSYKCGVVGDRSNGGDGAVLFNLLSATTTNDNNDDDKDSSTTSSGVNFDSSDTAQFAHIIRQEVTRVQVLSQFQLCQSGE